MKTRLFIILFLLHTSIIACDCTDHGPFLEAIDKAKLVVKLKIKRYMYKEIEGWKNEKNIGFIVEVLEVLQGTENRKEISVFCSYDAMCRPLANNLPLESTWIIALKEGEEFWYNSKSTVETKNDYHIDNCGEYYLPVKRKKVYGSINEWQPCWPNGSELPDQWSNDIYPAPQKKWTIRKLRKAIKNPKNHIKTKPSCY